MTVRHQLVVIGMLADQSRAGAGVRARPELLHDLEMRIARARTALDHGAVRPMPEGARTQPSKALIAAASAEEKAIREHAKRRTRQVRDLLRSSKSAKGKADRRAKRPATPAKRPAAASPKHKSGRPAPKPSAKRGGGARGR